MVGGLLLIALLLAHFFLIALFFAPIDKLLFLFIESDYGYLADEELPEPVKAFLITNNVTVDGDYQLNSSNKARLILGILQLRRKHFMNLSEQLTLDANLLNYGEDLVGIKSASEYYYKRPLSEVSDKEWITLVNLQKIFSKK